MHEFLAVSSKQRRFLLFSQLKRPGVQYAGETVVAHRHCDRIPFISSASKLSGLVLQPGQAALREISSSSSELNVRLGTARNQVLKKATAIRFSNPVFSQSRHISTGLLVAHIKSDNRGMSRPLATRVLPVVPKLMSNACDNPTTQWFWTHPLHCRSLRLSKHADVPLVTGKLPASD